MQEYVLARLGLHDNHVAFLRTFLSMLFALSAPLILAEPKNYYSETVECGRRCLRTGALGEARGATAVIFDMDCKPRIKRRQVSFSMISLAVPCLLPTTP